MSFEVLNENFINTTTQYSVESNTTLSDRLINRDPTLQYVSSGFDDDNTTTSITVSFDNTVSVDRITLLSHNLKSYTLFFNGATANTFSFTTTSATTTSDFSTNSETSQYFRTTPVDVTSVTLDMKQTVVADSEKAIGYFYISSLIDSFDRTPASKNYKPKIVPKQIVHKLSDGGQRIQRIQNKFSVDIKYKNITTSFRDELKSLYDRQDPFFFCPFGTATGWDIIFFETVWDGSFDFFRLSDDAVAAGFEGSIKLRETVI